MTDMTREDIERTLAELEKAHTMSEGAIHSIRAIAKDATGANCTFVDDDVKLIVKQRDDAIAMAKALEIRLRELLECYRDLPDQGLRQRLQENEQ